MALPNQRPYTLSTGPLEREILAIIWELGTVSVKDVLDQILSDPERELTYSSVTTVLRRLTNKGWLSCSKRGRVFYWQPVISKEEAQVLESYEKLKGFLAVSNPDLVATFADNLDQGSLEQLMEIAGRIKAIREARGG